MSQHDYDIANQSFPAFRTDLNNVLGAINTSNSGTSRPSGAVAGTIWLDTSGGVTAYLLKFFDGTDDITMGTINTTANTINFSDSALDVVTDLTPQLGGQLDVNGNAIGDGTLELLKFVETASAVNELTITNNATGNNPILSATGDDTNIGIALTPKGTGEIVIGTGNLNYAGTAITSTGAEINYSDLATLGTTAASKVFTADANNLTTVSGAVANVEDTLTDGATITWNVIDSPVAKVTLAGNRTLSAPSGTTPIAGQFVSLLIIQDGTGGRTITWNAAYEFAADTAPTLTATANLGDLFTFRYNGAKWLEVGRNLALTLS
jgi:hypothetical protein